MHPYHGIAPAFKRGANGRLATISCSTPLASSIYLTRDRVPTSCLFIAGMFRESFGMVIDLDKGIIG